MYCLCSHGIGKREEAISTIKRAASYYSLWHAFWRSKSKGIPNTPYMESGEIALLIDFFIKLLIILDSLWLKLKGALGLISAFRERSMYQMLQQDLEALEENRQIDLLPPPYIRPDALSPPPIGMHDANRLQEGRFHEVLRKALDGRDESRLLAIAASSTTTLHQDDPYYQYLFPANAEN